MHRALIVFLALAICLPSRAGIAATNYPPDSSPTSAKKPAPKIKAAQKKQNFAPAGSCNRATIDWGDYIRCGYDYPPWALGWDSFKRARAKSENR
jgi:hypothetical protein